MSPFERIENAANKLNGNIYISRRGVPLVEMMDAFGNGVNYSVCYFGRTNTWRIFEGYNDFSQEQRRITVPTLGDVIAFFNQKPYNTIVAMRCEMPDCSEYIRSPSVFCKKHRREFAYQN